MATRGRKKKQAIVATTCDGCAVYIAGEDLKRWRELLGLSQQELSRRLDYARSMVGMWERGAAPIPRYVYPRLLDALIAERKAIEARLDALRLPAMPHTPRPR